MMSHKKYLREQRAKQDKLQANLNPTTTTGLSLKQQKGEVKGVNLQDMTMCPFCLHIGKAETFVIHLANSIHQGLGECPECGNKTQWRTLTAEMTSEQFAEFVYNYRLSGFWQKCKFDKFRERLAKIGWSGQFWAKYKQLKGEDIEEHETIIQKQERMRWECQRCGEQNPPNTVMCKYCGNRLIESYG